MTRILLADDTLRDQERCRAWLAGEGCEVVGCATGAEAQQLTSAAGPDAVLVLWDLPGPTTGIELLHWLRRHHPNLPVLVLSGLLDWSRAARARKLGAIDFLLKPLERERFRQAVRAALGDRARPPLLEELRQRLVGASRPFLEMLEALARVIVRPGETVLLIGENGTGKELLARAVHDLGAVEKSCWVSVNVANLPPGLIESTLFGHEAGAFTDGRTRRIGLFEECGAGTLFLDEIGELDLNLQAKLLRVVQERTFRRVGGSDDLHCRARLVFATNRDLVREQRQGRFREDLYYRIAPHEIRVPPLRQRGDDLWLLVDAFLARYAAGTAQRLARETRELLATYRFPGNVRELEHVIRHALVEANGEILPFHLPVEVMHQRQPPVSEGEGAAVAWPEYLFGLPQKQAAQELENLFDREYLLRRLREARGNVTQAARSAELDPKTFRKKWDQAGLGALSLAE
jgi:DNA-binding NtrC family response regulator